MITALTILKSFFCFHCSDGKLRRYTPSSSQDATFEAASSSSVKGEYEIQSVKKWRRFMRLNDKDDNDDQKSLDAEPSNFFLT